MNLIDYLIQEKYLKTPRIIESFKKIKRRDFLPAEIKDLDELDQPLPIGQGQTISQPAVVAFMLELLQPQRGEKILDIGSGSGWTTALLAEIVGKNGKVIGIELIPELKEFGEKNVSKYNFIKKGIVEFVCADGAKYSKEFFSIDKILVSASLQSHHLPQNWKKQLKINGKIVVPIFSSIWLFIKKSEEEFEKIEYPGFAFVPFVTDSQN